MKDLKLEASSYIPVSIQLKEQLRHLIDTGSLPPGSKLPSVRELAGFLRINRNTVLRALAELERDGYLRREHGRGVYVRRARSRARRTSALDQLVDETLAHATQLGIAPESVALALLSRPAATSATTSKPRLLLVECNRPALRLYSEDLSGKLSVEIDTVLVNELRTRATEPGFLDAYRVAVTTMFHVEDVQDLCSAHRIPVIGLLPQASIHTLTRLISVPADSVVGIVCEDREGIQNVIESLRRAGVNRPGLRQATIADSEELTDLMRSASLVVTTKESAALVRTMAPTIEVIVEDGGVDRSAVELLRRVLASDTQNGEARPG